MAFQNLLDSKLSIQVSILIGKYLPPRMGYKFCSWIASLFANMKNLELSRNIRSNQYIVNGEKNTHHELVQFSKEVLFHAGKSLYDFYHFLNNPEKLEEIAPFSDSMREFISLCQGNQGYLVVAPHLSNFDLVVSVLCKNGFIGKVLSYPNPGSGYQLQNQLRKSYGLDLIPVDRPHINQEIIEYLKNGGVVATGIDRPIPGRKKRHYLNFFGHPSPLPVGYITTALAADVPIIVVTAIMQADGKYHFLYSNPITLTKDGNKLDEIKENAELILKQLEIFIRMAPEQWLMFYPVWPDLNHEEQ